MTPGARLGPYEVLSTLGAGGMGEVYRARDSKLNRDVAIKVLLPAVANDPDRLARFSREAQVLASLNHPNIAQIYGLDRQEGRDGQDGISFLVMELVDGEELAQRIARGPMPLDEALPIAKQIAEALEAAHEQGIIHRDLKPANIKVRADGTVKVLDFGLAKAIDPASGAAGGANAMTSPTLSIHATAAGMLLGTAAYMSPEQARGRVTDRRADIWAYGVVLFEMLTGTRAFDGGDLSSTLAYVITKDPDWNALPPALPVAIAKLLRRCLDKDPRRRLQAIGDARFEIDEALHAPATPSPPSAARPSVDRRVNALFVGAALVAGLLFAGVPAWMTTRRGPPPAAPVTRFVLSDQPLSIHGGARDVAISPDGTYIVYRVGEGQLAVRRLDQLDAHLLPGIGDARSPFFSPDSRWIAFFGGTELKKVSITGGPAITLSGVGIGTRGGSWTDDNMIVFGMDTVVGLQSVPGAGGAPQTLMKPDPSQRELGHWFPSVLPGGRGVLFTIASGDVESEQVAVFDLKTSQRKILIRGGSAARYVESGHLIYAAAGTLRAVKFDLARLEVIGDPVQILDHLMVANTGEANFDVSRQGTLVYVPGGVGKTELRQLVWVDRKGHEEPLNAEPRDYMIPRISPDGTQVAIQAADQERDIWTWNLARQTLTRVTFDPELDVQPIWTADSRRIIFSRARNGAFNLYSHAADGTGADTRLTTSPNQQFANSVTPDGAHIMGYEVPPQAAGDVMQFTMDGVAQPLFRTPFFEFNVEISPDGHYFAYQSDESGKDEVYVRPYPKANDARWQVSAGGGTRPAWARNGRELFYVDPANTLMSVPVQITSTFTAGAATRVFEAKYPITLPFRTYDVSPDGQRFLMIKNMTARDTASRPSLTVVLNWLEDVKAKLP